MNKLKQLLGARGVDRLTVYLTDSGGDIQKGLSYIPEVKVESKDAVRSFVIVGAAESDPAKGFISNESPLGSAFLGHKKGDKVEVRTPKGIVEYKVVEVN